MIQGRDIICFANDWSGDPLSKKHIMRVLAEKNRILWINSVTNRVPKVNSHDVRKVVRKLWEFSKGHQKVAPNIYAFTPLLFPSFHNDMLRRFNQRILVREIKSVLTQLNFSRSITWTFAPTSGDVVGNLGEDQIIYHCVDEFSSFSDAPKLTIQAMEQTLLEKAHLVITSSERLHALKRIHNKNCYVVTHGVDAEHFQKAMDSRTVVPDDVKNLPKPVIGFYGLIEDWIDLRLIQVIAEAHPEWSVVLVGSTKVDLAQLITIPNIHYLGRKRYEDLPSYCKAFDAALIPFVINELTLNANPLKFREYLSAALPVISTRLPEIEKYKDLVSIGDNSEGFVRCVERAVHENTATMRRRRIEAMQSETWESKVEVISALLQKSPSNGGEPQP